MFKYTKRIQVLLVLFLCCIILHVSCQRTKDLQEPKRELNQQFQTILDSSQVTGTILVFDEQRNTMFANDFNEAEVSAIPASTYKIPNTIIGLETGILKDESTVFKWNGEQRAFDIWEKDLTLRQAFQLSCVPCYQDLALNIGVERMKSYLDSLGYGQMSFDQTSLNNFWLVGKSKINALEQIDFLRRLYAQELPISKRSYKTIRKVLRIKENDLATLSGKTGMALFPEGNVAWFVGYLEQQENTIYFATRISPVDVNLPRPSLSTIRKQVVFSALKSLGYHIPE